MSIRRVVKWAAEAILGGHALTTGACRLRRPRVILAYHNVVADDAEPCGDPSLHIAFSRFVEHMRWVDEVFEIVPLEHLLVNRTESQPLAAVTFDDSYRGAVRMAIPWLAEAGIPSTVFVCPGLEGGEEMWWDVLASAGGLPASVRESALWRFRGRSDTVLEWADETNLPRCPLPPDLRIASADELVGVVASGRVAIGSHTTRHPNLAALSASELKVELEMSRDAIMDRWNTRAVDVLAYPYGLTSGTVAAAARDAGYEAALLISGGWLGASRSDRFGVPRLNVPAGLSLAGLRLRMAGFLS